MKWLTYVFAQTVIVLFFFLCALIVPQMLLKVILLLAGMFFLVRSMLNPDYMYRRLSVFLTTSGLGIMILSDIPYLTGNSTPLMELLNSAIGFLNVFIERNFWEGFVVMSFGVLFAAADLIRLKVAAHFDGLSFLLSPQMQITSFSRTVEGDGSGEKVVRLEINATLVNPTNFEMTLHTPIIRTFGFLPRRHKAEMFVIKGQALNSVPSDVGLELEKKSNIKILLIKRYKWRPKFHLPQNAKFTQLAALLVIGFGHACLTFKNVSGGKERVADVFPITA